MKTKFYRNLFLGCVVAVSTCLNAETQNLLTNGSFEEPAFASPSINSSPVVPGWSGIPFVFAGDNGSVWPAAAQEGNQFADAGNGSSFLVEQTFSVPASGLASITWGATTSSTIPSGTYRVELKSAPGGSVLESETFTVLGDASNKDIWDAETLSLSVGHGAGSYTLTFQSVDTSGQDFFIDEIIALAKPPSTISSSENFAWSANSGWVNFRPTTASGAVVNEGFLSGRAYATNLGWINLGDGEPANGYRYTNSDGADSGINLEADGKLTGLAWSANAGWIKFDWAGATNSTRPRIDLLTGEIEGFAYGANVGWIKLTDLTTDSMHCIDRDGDGLGDAWEFEHFGDRSTANTNTDADGDGATDLEEYAALSDPNDAQDSIPDPALDIALSPLPQFPDFWRVSFSGRPGRSYQLCESIDLVNWSPIGAPSVFSTTGNKSLVAGPVDSTKREFFKLIHSKPLQP